MKSIEPLCHYCHNFIHSGRMAMILGKEKSIEEVVEILEHGFRVLSENNLKCFPFTLEFAKSLGAETFGVRPYKLPKTNVGWNDWKLIFEGKEYFSNFKDEEEWRNSY